MNEKPLVSIITVCYNSEKVISSALESVLQQSYKNIEHIVIDGLSQDNTLTIIKEYEPLYEGRMVIVSEKDEGIYDAINKGIKLAKGSIIGILNSDDWYTEEAIEKIIQNYEGSVDIYHGNINKVRVVGNCYYTQHQIPGDLSSLTKLMSINHSSCFVTRQWYEKKMYDTAYKIAADYKFILESYLEGAKFKYIDYCFTYMRIWGASSSNIKTILEGYSIRKELLGKNQVVKLCRDAAIFYYYRLRKLIACIILPKKFFEQYEIKKWERIDFENVKDSRR